MNRNLYAPALVLALASCGSTKEWAAVPVAEIPIAPGPTPPEAAPPATQSAAPPAASAKPALAAAGATPMSGELPDVDTGLSSAAACKEKECVLATVVAPGAASDPKGPAAVWSHDIAKGSSLNLPRNAEIDVYAVVVKGAVVVKPSEGGADVPLRRWSALRAPGAGISIAATDAPARLVLAAVTFNGNPISAAAAKLRDKDTSKIKWTARPTPIELADLAASKDLAWAGGSMHARIGFEGDKQRASLGLLLGSKDAAVAQHQHDGTWEVLAILRGTGSLKHAKAAGSTDLASLSVTDGTIAFLPPGAQHAWQPKGDKPLVAIQLYAPPGPEQRFKKLAEGK